MLKRLLMIFAITTGPAAAQVDLQAVVDQHILAGYEALDQATTQLARTTLHHCAPDDPDLRAAYSDAFDAWLRVSHLRFGPSETGDRAFALAFWPDSRGKTPRALAALIVAEDPVIDDMEDFATVSIAARGFYALEFLIDDDTISTMGSDAYRCRLVQAIAADISSNVIAMRQDWNTEHAALLANPGNDTYRTRDEALREVFKALSTGLEFTADTRLGRPMGTFDRPRPNRAEARRSGRSLRHVILSLEGLRGLARLLSDNDPILDQAFERALSIAAKLDDPVFAGVATPQGRFRVEVLQQAINSIRLMVSQQLGPKLGVAAGFNSMDGD